MCLRNCFQSVALCKNVNCVQSEISFKNPKTLRSCEIDLPAFGSVSRHSFFLVGFLLRFIFCDSIYCFVCFVVIYFWFFVLFQLYKMNHSPDNDVKLVDELTSSEVDNFKKFVSAKRNQIWIYITVHLTHRPFTFNTLKLIMSGKSKNWASSITATLIM